MTGDLVMDDVTILLGDARERLREVPDGSVQCIITSPPFWALRDYGTGTWEGGDPDCGHLAPPVGGPKSGILEGASKRDGNGGDGQYIGSCKKCGAERVDHQIGQEETPEEWASSLVEVFRECKRVLRDDGVMWLECGDTYAASSTYRAPQSMAKKNGWAQEEAKVPRPSPPNVKAKDLVGAPWLLAFALRADGWYLRSDTIWHRPNPMPESVGDRPTKAHSYVFLMTKSATYFYDSDAIREPHKHDGRKATTIASNGAGVSTHENYEGRQGGERWPGAGANARSVWSIPTEPTPFAHFATFPQALVEKCIKAGTSEHGCCAECGAPWARVTERAIENPGNRSNNGVYGSHEEKLRRGFDVRREVSVSTTGWEPTCECHGQFTMVPTTEYNENGEPVVTKTRTYYEEIPLDEHPIAKQIVLDPFMGSGTTALVARRLGRHALGVELSEAYMLIAEDRLKQLSLLT